MLSSEMVSTASRQVSDAVLPLWLLAFADISSLSKSQRNQHVQVCTRRDIASKREHLQSDVHYCHWCFTWVVGAKEWKEHCQIHIDSLGTKRCGLITYCHTLVRPGHCPFCLGGFCSGSSAKLAERRLQSWCRDLALWQHVDAHLEDVRWPLTCPHPLCDVSLVDGEDLRFHFIDDHDMSRVLPKTTENLGISRPDSTQEQKNSQKRTAPANESELIWTPQEQLSSTLPHKKMRRTPSTIAPSQLSNDDKAMFSLPLIDLTATDSSTDLIEKEDNPWLPSAPESEQNSLSRFGSRDTTVVDSPCDHSDGDLFANYIRSPSPDAPSVAITSDRFSASVVDIDDLVPSSAPEDEDISLARCETRLAQSRDCSTETAPKLRIRLRVGSPKTKIKLRVSKSTRKAPTKSTSTSKVKPKPKPKPKTKHTSKSVVVKRQQRKKTLGGRGL